MKIFSLEEHETADWVDLPNDSVPSTFTWYKVCLSSHIFSTHEDEINQTTVMENFFLISHHSANT